MKQHFDCYMIKQYVQAHQDKNITFLSLLFDKKAGGTVFHKNPKWNKNILYILFQSLVLRPHFVSICVIFHKQDR